MTRSPPGFTLVEMAVALFVIALLLGGILVPLVTRVEQKQISDTQKVLDEVREALLGHAAAFGYLPCPDLPASNDGLEDVAASGQCSSISSGRAHGNLPFQTLGLANSDVWGDRFRYTVREEYARRAPDTSFGLSTTNADLRVCEAAGCGGVSTITQSAVVVILSHGRNGFGATKGATGLQVNCTPTHPGSCSADEQENFDSNRDFVSHPWTASGSGAGEFDDIVTWIPLYVLFNRMVTAGKIP